MSPRIGSNEPAAPVAVSPVPNGTQTQSNRTFRGVTKQVVLAISMWVIVLAIAAAVGVYRFGSIANVMQFLQGECVVVTPACIDLGAIAEETRTKATATFTNLTNETVTLSRVMASCFCSFTSDFPIELQPYTSRHVSFVATLPAGRDRLDEKLVVFTDVHSQAYLVLQITAKSKEPSS